jgi:type VI secretion system protein VasD
MVKGARLRRLLGVVPLAASLLAACSGAPPPPPPPGIIELTLQASADLNPDATGRPSPVIVRIYQLTSATQFATADFFQLFEKQAATLGADLSNREELAIFPGETRKLTTPLKQGAQFVGLAASFRDIDKASWRAVTEVSPNGTTALEGALSNVTVTLNKAGS